MYKIPLSWWYFSPSKGGRVKLFSVLPNFCHLDVFQLAFHPTSLFTFSTNIYLMTPGSQAYFWISGFDKLKDKIKIIHGYLERKVTDDLLGF